VYVDYDGHIKDWVSPVWTLAGT